MYLYIASKEENVNKKTRILQAHIKAIIQNEKPCKISKICNPCH